MEILAAFPDTSTAHVLLQRLFEEQYVIEDGKAVLRDRKEIKADSLQNPNDPDATFRNKNEQKVQGYVTNITETLLCITQNDRSGQTKFKICHF